MPDELTPDLLTERGYFTRALGNALHSGEHSFQNVPGLMHHVLDLEAWKERIVIETGQEIEGYSSFREYAEDHPPSGLGTTMALVKKIVSSELELQKRLAKALRFPTRGNPTGINQHTGGIKSTGLNSSEEKVEQLAFPEEKKKKQDQYGKRILQLEKKAPDLYAQVIAGEKTVYAASVEAKIDHPTMTVTLDSPKSAASLIAKASPAFIEELRRLLNT